MLTHERYRDDVFKPRVACDARQHLQRFVLYRPLAARPGEVLGNVRTKSHWIRARLVGFVLSFAGTIDKACERDVRYLCTGADRIFSFPCCLALDTHTSVQLEVAD